MGIICIKRNLTWMSLVVSVNFHNYLLSWDQAPCFSSSNFSGCLSFQMTFLTEVQTAFSVGAYWLVGYSLDRGKMQSIRRSFVVVQNTSSATFAFALEMQCGQIHPRPSPNVVWVIRSQRAFDLQLNPFTSVLIAEFALQWPWGNGNLFFSSSS